MRRRSRGSAPRARLGGLALLLCACLPSLREADETTRLWPDGAPGARGSLPDDRPELYWFMPPPERRNGAAAVVASGGSYGHHGGLHGEGLDTARWLVSQGFVAVVVRYRVHGPRDYDHADFLADGERAVRTLRSRADELRIDPTRIGMFGFSAGGHLASSVAIHCAQDEGDATATDVVERASCEIAFAVMVYPVITLDDRWAHRRSRRNMLGGIGPSSPELRRSLSTDTQVTSTTAPGFLVHSTRDTKVVAHNSVLYHEALVRHGVPSELWIFEDGRHGVGLADDVERMPAMHTWPERCLAWLRGLGVLSPDEPNETR